jgi:hypothetical protein
VPEGGRHRSLGARRAGHRSDLPAIGPTVLSYASLSRHAPSAGAAAAWLWVTINPTIGLLAGLVMSAYFVSDLRRILLGVVGGTVPHRKKHRRYLPGTLGSAPVVGTVYAPVPPRLADGLSSGKRRRNGRPLSPRYVRHRTQEPYAAMYTVTILAWHSAQSHDPDKRHGSCSDDHFLIGVDNGRLLRAVSHRRDDAAPVRYERYRSDSSQAELIDVHS